jgi:hypothetical protein
MATLHALKTYPILRHPLMSALEASLKTRENRNPLYAGFIIEDEDGTSHEVRLTIKTIHRILEERTVTFTGAVVSDGPGPSGTIEGRIEAFTPEGSYVKEV